MAGIFRVIDPADVENFNRTRQELEEFVLFTTVVAGKNALIQAKKLDDFLGEGREAPFEYLRGLISRQGLGERLREHRIGQYRRLEQTFSCLAQGGIDLSSCSINELEEIPGIGPKTARFFVIYSRPNIRAAALDTHILRYLRDMGHQAPKTTPSSKSLYAKLEALVLEAADEAGMPMARFDIEVWKRYSGVRAGDVLVNNK